MMIKVIIEKGQGEMLSYCLFAKLMNKKKEKSLSLLKIGITFLKLFSSLVIYHN